MASAAPPLGKRPHEPVPGKDSLANPQGHEADGKGPACPDCGLPFGEHPEYHSHGDYEASRRGMPGGKLDEPNLGGDPAGG